MIRFALNKLEDALTAIEFEMNKYKKEENPPEKMEEYQNLSDAQYRIQTAINLLEKIE